MKTDVVPAYAKALRAAMRALASGAVAIYGLGVVARDLLQVLDDFNVLGLMDKDPANVGKTMYGTTVLSDAEVIEKKVDTIIIAASDVYWKLIATRIAPLCQPAGIRVLFLDGTSACVQDDTRYAPELEQCDYEELSDAINTHDVISFDLFETLVTRFASRPDDILEVAMARMSQQLGGCELLPIRKEAEAACCVIHGQYQFSLDQVYSRIEQHSRLPGPVLTRLKDLEISTEIGLSVPRTRMVRVFSDCLKSYKQVCITTDTHLPREAIMSILRRCGLPEVPVFISGEAGASKLSGELFEVVRSKFPNRRILHIGDHAKADFKSPHEHGFGAYQIFSCGTMLANSRFRQLLVHARTTHDGILLGMISRALFHDPFTPLDGPTLISDLRQFGYVFFGPVVLAWMVWLIDQLRHHPTDRLLFIAREGHLLSRIYNMIRTACRSKDLPEGSYFAASRRMAAVASLRTPEDVRALLDDDFSGTPKQLLELRYGLKGVDAISDGHITNKATEAAALVEQHMERILANAADERECYLAYIRGLGAATGARIMLADLGIKGTIQYCLQRMLGTRMFGCYITGFFGSTNPYGMTANTAALFPNCQKAESSNVYRYHLLWESVLVAPEGMYVRVNPDETFVNAPVRKNQQLFDKKSQIHAGIEAFVSDWLTTGVSLEHTRFSLELVDAIFGMSMSSAVNLHESIKSTLYVDENYRIESEKRIFD